MFTPEPNGSVICYPAKAGRPKRLLYYPADRMSGFCARLNWLQVVMTGSKGASALIHIRFWTTRGVAQTTKREREQRLLRDVVKRWGRMVVRLWDRGSAGASLVFLAFQTLVPQNGKAELLNRSSAFPFSLNLECFLVRFQILFTA